MSEGAKRKEWRTNNMQVNGVLITIDQFWYVKIHNWLLGLGAKKKKNVLFIPEPWGYFSCVISPRLGAKYKFDHIKIAL